MLNKLFPFKVNPLIDHTSKRLERALIDNIKAVNELRDQLRHGETHLTVVKTIVKKPQSKANNIQ